MGVEVMQGLSNPFHPAAKFLSGEITVADLPKRPSNAPERLRPIEVQRRLTPSEVQDLIKAYEAGSSVNQLADRFDIHRATVLSHLERAGVPRRHPRLDDAGIEEATQLYIHGMSLAEVGECLG